MGILDFRIYFDNPDATYHAGDFVTGKVVIKLDSPERIRFISAKFKGEANVKWMESDRKQDKNGSSRTVDVSYTAHEEYFEATQYITGNPSQESLLPPGVHTFTFSTTLPQYLPTSFEGKHGHIRYILEVIMDRPQNTNHSARAAFTVLSHVDLNLDPSLKKSASRTVEKSLCCLCCKSGPLTLDVVIPATGFVSGQEIPVTIEVENGSNKTVNNVICSLKQNVCFTAGIPEKKMKKVTDKVTTIAFESVAVNDSATWTKKLKIPPLPPSNLKNCAIISLDYCLEIKAVIDGPHINLHVSIPITLGTVPLLNSVPYGSSTPASKNPGIVAPTSPAAHLGRGAFQQPIMPTAPHLPVSNVPPFAPQAQYPGIPLPSYEECMYATTNTFSGNNSRYTQGQMVFAPRYPTYNFNVSQ